jgi:hypothetical protein
MIDWKKIKKMMANNKSRGKVGKILALSIIHGEELDRLDEMSNLDIATAMGLKPGSMAEVARGRATYRQLLRMGYTITKVKE